MPLQHIVIQARPTNLSVGPEIPWEEGTLRTWRLPAGRCPLLPVRFEDALLALEQFQHLFAEPDGSFVWTYTRPEKRCRLEGQLHDGGPTLWTVECKGDFGWETLEHLLRVLEWPAHPLIFQWVRAGVFLDEDALRAVLPK